MSGLAEALRRRHFVTQVWSHDYETGEDRDFDICNQDGQAWPCSTEQIIREHEKEE